MAGQRALYEATVHCPQCTALETLLFEGRVLVHTQRWGSYRGGVFHKPCRRHSHILDMHPV